ncbi:hypothetical protein ACED63_10970 [Vibrio splendidus]|uniref:hypothetical protein n=1 Tax=Vibrio splendidus TaxID=29497 RepID=UPI00352E31DE
MIKPLSLLQTGAALFSTQLIADSNKQQATNSESDSSAGKFLGKHSGRTKNSILQKMVFNCEFYNAALSVALVLLQHSFLAVVKDLNSN